ncbi:MAG: tetratricopeptide repeat protein [Nevskiaceae bacterium]
MAAAGLLLAASGCASAGEPRFSNPRAKAQYHVMVGEMAAQRRQPEVAAREFLKALEFSPEPELAMRAASLALAAKNEPLALQAARRWQELAPDDADPREAVARLALRAGKRDETLKQCEALIRGHAGGPAEGFRQVAQVLSQEGGKQSDALAVMDQLRRQWPELAGGWHAQSLLALRFNNIELAEKSAREALRVAPGSRESLLLLSGVLVRKGDIAGADAAMAEVLKAEGADAVELRMGYARLLLEAGQLDAARREFEAILAARPDAREPRFALGLLELERENLDGAEPHFTALLEAPEFRQRAAYYLGRIEEVRRNPARALEWYGQVTEGEQALEALTRRALALGKLGRAAEARRLLTEMRREMPMFAPRFYLAEGELLLDTDAAPEALALYDQALREHPDEPDLLYGRSLVHERLKDVGAAEADLRRILSDDADDARAMNALGYMLTVHTERLDEARKLIVRALELMPDDAAVIDSLGWVEFRQGRHRQALALLEKAFSKARDPEIAAHLGEVLWTLGDREQARAVWDAALTRDPDHRVLRDTVDRLTR